MIPQKSFEEDYAKKCNFLVATTKDEANSVDMDTYRFEKKDDEGWNFVKRKGR